MKPSDRHKELIKAVGYRVGKPLFPKKKKKKRRRRDDPQEEKLDKYTVNIDHVKKYIDLDESEIDI